MSLFIYSNAQKFTFPSVNIATLSFHSVDVYVVHLLSSFYSEFWDFCSMCVSFKAAQSIFFFAFVFSLVWAYYFLNSLFTFNEITDIFGCKSIYLFFKICLTCSLLDFSFFFYINKYLIILKFPLFSSFVR